MVNLRNIPGKKEADAELVFNIGTHINIAAYINQSGINY